MARPPIPAAGDAPPDSQARGLTAWLPAAWRPFALLARFDRPIGWWLLFWPGAAAVALGAGGDGLSAIRWPLIGWLLVGSIAMRGAGCVYNDIVDRDLDARVERTRSRPLASGRVSLKAAWAWLVLLSLVGLAVLLQLRPLAQAVALASLALVAAYPFMKRITWWPQVWLGLVFSWAALVGWAETAGALSPPGLLLYTGGIFWTIGYDSIYAMQDREDDALIGVKSSALAMGRHVRFGVTIFYALAILCWGGALWTVFPRPVALAALLPLALHLCWQVATLRDDGADPLAKFRSNRGAGALLFLACLVVGSA